MNGADKELARLRDAFEEAYKAVLLLERGKSDCDDMAILSRLFNRPATRAERGGVSAHAKGCKRCRRTLSWYPSAADALAALEPVELPRHLETELFTEPATPRAAQVLPEAPGTPLDDARDPRPAATGVSEGAAEQEPEDDPEREAVADAGPWILANDRPEDNSSPGEVTLEDQAADVRRGALDSADDESHEPTVERGETGVPSPDALARRGWERPKDRAEDKGREYNSPASPAPAPERDLPPVVVFGPPPRIAEPQKAELSTPGEEQAVLPRADEPPHDLSFSRDDSSWREKERRSRGVVAGLLAFSRRDKLVWTYLLLGQLTVLAVLLGILVAKLLS